MSTVKAVKRIPKKRMSWTLIFIFISGISALIAGILQYNDRLKSSEKTKNLQEELLNYTRGSKIFPIVDVVVPTNTRQVLISIRNPDTKGPMLNVAGLINSTPFNYGALYPSAAIQVVQKPFDTANQLQNKWVIQLYYSNTEFLMIAVEVYEIHGKFKQTINYAGRDMIDITPDNQKNINEAIENEVKQAIPNANKGKSS